MGWKAEKKGGREWINVSLSFAVRFRGLGQTGETGKGEVRGLGLTLAGMTGPLVGAPSPAGAKQVPAMPAGGCVAAVKMGNAGDTFT